MLVIGKCLKGTFVSTSCDIIDYNNFYQNCREKNFTQTKKIEITQKTRNLISENIMSYLEPRSNNLHDFYAAVPCKIDK